MNVEHVVMRFVVALAMMFVGTALVQPPEAAAGSVHWRIKNNTERRIQFVFHSQSRRLQWPGDGKAYAINDGDTHEYYLACRAGEKICFGAWVTGDSTIYWGVGADNKHSCKKCCHTCDAGELALQVLNP